MPTKVEVPVVEAAPQDAHDDADTVARPTVVQWRSLPQLRRATVGADVRVGVVDTPFGNHPWFAGQVHGDHAGHVDGLLSANYKAGHGTFVSGLILQQAPAAHVTVRGVLDAGGEASTASVLEEALRLVERKLDNGRRAIDILNLSLGCYGSDEEREQFRETFRAMWTANPELVVVVAAGNKRNDDRPFYPGALADHARLVTVGAAADSSGTQWAEFSNQGPYVTFRAVGTDLVSTFLRFTTIGGNPEGRWARWGGTSFATAIVSGIVAATMSPGEGLPRMSGPQAVAKLLGGGPPPVSLAIRPLLPGSG